MSEVKKQERDFSSYYPFFFTLIFLTVILQYDFSTLESIFYDLRVRLDAGHTYKDRYVIVTLDEESDLFLGESYPYSYSGHKRFYEKLLFDRPKIVASTVAYTGPVSERDYKNMEETIKLLQEFSNKSPSFIMGTQIDPWGESLPPKEFDQFPTRLGMINIDNNTFAKDDVPRRSILNISGENSFHLEVANAYREKTGLTPWPASSIKGSYYLENADATFALFRYFTSPSEQSRKIKRIPFHRVLVGNFPKNFFKDKIVIIAPSYVANSANRFLSPFNKKAPQALGPALHANIIEAFIENKTVIPVPRVLTNVLVIFLAFILSFLISIVRPTRGLVITLSSLLGAFFLSYLLFITFGLWVYVSHIVLTIFVIYYIWVPFKAISEYKTRFHIEEETKLLKRVEGLKQNFISLMSHDLKTPVAKIAGLADVILQQGGHDMNSRRNLVSIIDSTKELNRFISSILDLTKIESEKVGLSIVSKDINKILQDIINELKFEAATQKIGVKHEFAPLYPIGVDITFIKRVFFNLIENAIKYSGENSEISIKTWDDDQWVYVEISDNGVGVAPDDLKHIFDKFYRVKNDASHSIKGTGLGLYLVKYFVELHEGVITVKSELQKGTTFRVKLKNK